MPAAAVDVLKQRHAQRIFSTAPFGGYLVSRDVKSFIDGRAELYGEKFVMDYFAGMDANDKRFPPQVFPVALSFSID